MPDPKPKLNLTIREASRKKLEHLARLENRSLSNLIEVMGDERWDRLAHVEGFPFVKIISDIATEAKVNIANPDEMHRFRTAVLDQFVHETHAKHLSGNPGHHHHRHHK